MKMFDQLNAYKEQLEDHLSDLESKDYESEVAQERNDERIEALQGCIDTFDELLEGLSEYQDEYKGLARL
ncbi:MAG: hypothetical protein PHE51_08275 [Eubacteriales bacterium]|nr:hypothetical protein [Eubacteriales bacterium]